MKKTSKGSEQTILKNGFTIVELLVAMTISLITMGAVYSVYRSQQQSYIVQDQVAAVQQNLRAAMYVMTRDIRMAGFNPTLQTAVTFGVTDAEADKIILSSDLDGGGDSDANEIITYFLDNTTHQLKRNAGGGDQVVAENIEALGFAYSYDTANDGLADMSANNFIIWAVDSDGDGSLDLNLDTNDDGVTNNADDADSDDIINGNALSSPISVEAIKSVKIWLIARTDKRIKDYSDNNTYVVGNKIVTPENGYMYRLMSETARCRNL